MERYSEYKDSGVKWLGEIPSHWEVLPIKYISKVNSGATPKTSIQGYWDGNITWVTPADFKTETKFVLKGNRNITTLGVQSCSTVILPKGSLVFSKRAPIGQVSISKLPLCTNQGCFGIIPDKSMNNSFLYYSLAIHTKAFYTLGSGTTFRELSFSAFSSYKISVPPRAEQDAIVRYLDAATSKIDKAIAMQQKMIDLLNERKQIIIQNAVTKGLDENVEMKDSGVEWIGMIPKHWKILKLKRCASIKTGTTPPTNERKYFDGGRISWFTPGDLNDLHLEFASKMITKKAIDDKVGRLFPAKTIYFVGIGATVAKVSACDFAASSNQQINAIICKESLDYIFATYVLKSEQEFIRNMANYVTLPIINQSDTGLIDMIVPPKSEQQAIVAYLDKEMQRFDSAISNCQRQITLLQERKQIIINEVVTGKVKVS